MSCMKFTILTIFKYPVQWFRHIHNVVLPTPPSDFTLLPKETLTHRPLPPPLCLHPCGHPPALSPTRPEPRAHARGRPGAPAFPPLASGRAPRTVQHGAATPSAFA